MNRLVPTGVLLALLISLSVVSGTAHANSTVGAWSLGPVWDISPINMLVLPTGKVMFYPGDIISGDDPRMWDPATNTLTSLAQAGYDLFCNGHSFMKDGTIFFAGGNLLSPYDGLPNASLYNPFTNIWTHLPDMNAARWYPSTTTLANGDVLVMTGTIDSTQMENPLPQIWQAGSGTWRNLTNAMLKIFTYPWVYATPSGKAFLAGPEAKTRYLDMSGTGSWTTLGNTNHWPNSRDYGSSVMYGPYNILIAGGGQTPTNTAEIINLSDATPTWQYTNPMAFPRRHMNMTLLPDDNVLVTGGTRAEGFNNTTQPVYAAEMWNITTRTWTTMASQTVGRFYHSNALLLPDGRVLSAGGTNSSTYTYQAEIYSPPYLFKGARPTITSAPTHAGYGETFFVATPDATNIVKARLIRLPAVTHAFDMNQRLIQVSFTQAGGGLNMTAPVSGNFAPPGHYMLFILNNNGVPSVAKIIQIDDDPTAPTVPAAPSGLVATATSSSAISLTWADQANNEDGFKIERKTGAGSFTQIGTVGPNVTTYPDSGLAASTSYSYQVRAYNTVGNSGYSNTDTATTSAPAAVPADPTGLVATANSSSAISLTWADQANNEDGFKIERKTGAGSFTQIGVVGPNVTTYPDSGLAASTSYSYQVRAYNTTGNSGYSNTASATTSAPTGIPPAPTSLGAIAISGSSISLTWVDQSTNETGFKIERALGAGAFSQVATVGANVTTYANSGLAANTAYSYRVRASNTGGDSAFTNTAAGTTFNGVVNVAAATLDSGFSYVVNQVFGTPGDTSAAPTQSVLRIFENGAELGPAHSSHSQIRTVGMGRFSHWGNNLFFSASNNTNPRTNGRTYAYRIGFPSSPPTAPSGLNATAASSTAINLTWVDQSTNETGFKIERALGAGAFSQVATVGANVTTYPDGGLAAGTSYSYRVRASNTGGDSSFSNTGSATTLAAPPPIPAPPSGLGATAASSSAINLSWTDAAVNETGFKIERKTGAGAFAQIGTVGPNITTYADSGLTASTAYSYQVRAYNTGGDSTYSNTASATTLAAPPPIPAPPSGLGATAASSSAINLSWTDAATNEDGFKIERKTGAGAFAQIGTVGPNITTYADSGLTASTAYSYQVRAYNTGGDSTYSNTSSATTGVALPAAPSGLLATTSFSTMMDLTWTDQSTNETSFKIERKTGAGAFSQVGTVGADVTNFTDTGLSAATSYSYRVRASNTSGDSSYSNTATASTLPTPPAPPSGLGATAASGSAINLSWTDAATNEDGFKIERKTGAGAFAQIGTVGPNITTYADSGLTASTAYSYQVRAYNTGGDSTYSNTGSTTTWPPIPAAPSGLGATAASSSAINLSWTDAATNEDGFKIERKTGAGAFAQIGTVGPNITTYADSGLTASTAYSYQVRAHNTGGDSTYSNTSSATTWPPIPAPPSGLGATAASSSAINLSWTDAATNEDGFKIERKTGAGAFAQIGTVGPNITTYADSGLTASTAYSYQVRAYNTGGDSTYSNTSSATTWPPIPAPPSGLGATAASSSAINLSWTDAATNEDGFKIERKTGAGAFAQIGTVGPNITTYADSGLTASTAYSYQVRAYNTGGDSTYSNTSSATTWPPIPAPPSGLGATAASGSAINLSWTDAATNEDGFKIERKTGAGAFAQIGTVGPNITTYADSGLTASTAYSYQVRAYNTGGDSTYSNTSSATTSAAPPPIPAPPSGLGATAASSSAINLSWTDAATNEDGFKIERKTGAGAFAQIGTVGPNITTYADSGLTASTAYSYQVRAYNTGGDSTYSNTSSATTSAAPPPIPAPPSGLGATAASSSAINLSWTDAATNEDGFKIERKTGAGAFAQIGTVGPNITTYADSGLTASTAYSYQVRAYNTGGDSTYSNTSSATTWPPVPAPPSGLGATAASGSAINLSWTDAATNEDGFKIERKTGAGAFAQIGTVGPNITTYADSGLTASTAYSYQVRAYNTGGDSAYSNTSSATTWPPVPAPPSGLGATAASGSAINLSWTDAATNEDGFKIERKTGAGAFVQIGTVGPNITTYADSGLTASTAYSYQVRAYNTGGDSAYSNTASATTLVAPPPIPAPPSGLGATAASSSAINLSWTDAATNEDGFKIERKTGAGAFVQIGTVGPNITTYADSGLTASTAYSYQVRAYNTGGDSTYSNTASATTLAAPPPIPAPPSGLGATAASSSAINLSWTDAATNETGFKIERKTGAGAFAQIGTVGPNITTYADSGLTASTAYSYQVRAYNTGGDSTYSNTASATTLAAPPPIPAPPSGLGATAASSSAINLSWTDAATNETGFKIERKTGAGAFTQIGTVGPNITTYADSGLTASTAYSYQVRAYNTGGDSTYSNTASATTQAATAPAAPTGLVKTAASSTTVTVTWVDQANNEDGFKIERKTGTGSFAQIATVGPNITTYANSGLASATNYTYRVRAYNTVGNSAYSNTASATTSGVINVAAASPNGGFAYIVSQNFGTPGDTNAQPTRSVLRIFENGIELSPAHSEHSSIRNVGMGRFSHWGSNLYFSASDNTDPRTNGRTYTYRVGATP